MMTTRPRRLGQLDADAAWKTFFQDPDWMFKTGIGGMINATSIILFILTPLSMPIICALLSLINGYLMRVIRYKTLNPESKLPEWDDWLELFMSGLTWLAIQFGIFLLLIVTVTIALWLALAFGNTSIASPYFLLWAFGATAIVTAMAVLLSFCTPLLMVNFAIEERVPSGLAFRQVLTRAALKPKEFLLAWLLTIGVSWASALVPTLTIIGLFIIPSTIFVGQILCVTIWAQVWGPERI